MIKSWKHKGLKRFYDTGKTSGIQGKHEKRLKIILQRLDAAIRAEDLDLPGMRFHKLKGKLKDCYSVTVNGNWRVIYKFENGHAILVDYLDYRLRRGEDMVMHNPLHPGLIVKDALIDNTDLTVTEAADRLGVTRTTLSRLINGKSGISPEMALRLSKLFGNSVEMWLNLQMQYDVWQIKQHAGDIDVDELGEAA